MVALKNVTHPQAFIGTGFFLVVAALIAVLVVPVLLAGRSPYPLDQDRGLSRDYDRALGLHYDQTGPESPSAVEEYSEQESAGPIRLPEGSDGNDHCRGSRCPPTSTGAARRAALSHRHAGLIPPSNLLISGSRSRARSNHGGMTGGAHGPGGSETEAEEPEPEYASIQEYLATQDEELSQVLGVSDILGDPSNIIDENGLVDLLAWDVREEEPRGSYLYVLQQTSRNNISQVHRFFCSERRLDILAETCIPLASVYSNSGVPTAVGYSGDGLPYERDAADLNPALFSRRKTYVEANDFLLNLQEYFNSVRG